MELIKIEEAIERDLGESKVLVVVESESVK